ncbi:4a-hydroxytetrahydrobiopterin dehydratase [Flagellimonas halotolerans]|uniref:Putative pterin-4-alpha-carbinolamine dehydratase n=1 Tax=Flagellimonas halotolerans TaxID=3112164 RepID=A0ABU6IRH1_9FLAO|nr:MULTISPECIES: 4a-hydroxytetrahydrobiopterin dehydratase [unclassified Allomuricauda]MEC3965809.1 4a-hydroxytetrahydrobiopterin dehydratase [Muricauda sp. SYSU M86414]MEC4265725.1 4a-hydroxytetrahydrobiopterin dehydratase [Muricauda sp. SYSU M84420]
MKKLTTNEIAEALKNLSGWALKDDMIEKTFTFKDFKEAFATMTHIAFECEKQNHHPNWENVYNSLTIKLSTHDADGLTQKDIDLAKSIDEIVG